MILDIADVQIHGACDQDNIGWQISATGDVDGDGFDDFFLGTDQDAGSPGEPFINFGHIIYGATALPETIPLADPGVRRILITDYEPFVSSAPVGDFNGDGLDDLLLGNPLFTPNDLSRAGEVFVLYGSPSLPDSFSILDPQVPGVKIQGHVASGFMGSQLAPAGDVNGDGFADIVFSAPGPISQELREAYIVYGGADVPKVLVSNNLGMHGVRLEAAHSGSSFGSDVAGAGDVNGDGFDDVLIGARGAESGIDNAYIVYGGTDIPQLMNIADLNDRGVHLVGTSEYQNFGDYVAGAGDIDRDGFSDVLVSGWAADRDGLVNTGVVYVFWGAPNLPDEIYVDALGQYGLEIRGPHSEAYYGESLAGPGDVNRDGYCDLLIASYRSAERVNIIYGKPELRQLRSVMNSDLDRVAITDTGFNRLGLNIAYAGDVNADGWEDILIGDPASRMVTTAGTTYLIYGGKFGLIPTPTATPTESESPTNTPTLTPTITPTPKMTQDFSGWILSGEGEVRVISEPSSKKAK